MSTCWFDVLPVTSGADLGAVRLGTAKPRDGSTSWEPMTGRSRSDGCAWWGHVRDRRLLARSQRPTHHQEPNHGLEVPRHPLRYRRHADHLRRSPGVLKST